MPSEVHTDKADKPVLDLSRYELRVEGRRARLERQPMELLAFLVQRRGQLVTRDEIVERIWGKDIFVDVDASINSAIRKIRAALKDDPGSPKFLETVVGKGYRFVGEIELLQQPTGEPAAQIKEVREGVREAARTSPSRMLGLGLSLVLVLVLAGWWLIRWRASSKTHPEFRSVAVLPLNNLSGDASQDYFADGMTDELTTDLAKVSSLKVISRTSAQRYRGSNKNVQQIGRELGVDIVVEGSVARSKDKVRVTAQLIDAVHDRHIWAESYERDLDDVLSVQNAVALEIARQIRIRLTASEQQRLQRKTPVDPEAYDAYLKGRYAQSTQSAEGIKEGLPEFQKAIALDPNFAPAYAGLADMYSLLANYRVLSPSEAFPLAEAAARRALQLDANSAEAHTALAFPEHHYTWQWAAAEQEYKAAIGLSPSYPTAHLRYAEYLSSVGRHDEAIAEVRRTIELDPLSPLYSSNLGRFLYHARRYDEAIEVLKKALEVDPARAYTRIHLAMCYDQKRMYREAMAEFDKADASLDGKPGAGMAHLLADSGKVSEARSLVKTLRAQARDSDWFLLAGVYAALGEKDAAFECLQKAFEKHDFYLVFLKVHPYMDPLRADPRYTELARRIGLP
jgi:TolB-like protein/DNA-binding winged helix-turn-helix (wHTH) protein/Tfp pilus assembly protein PilF